MGLQEFTEYKVRVQARTAKGTSEWSEPVRYTMSQLPQILCMYGTHTYTISEIIKHSSHLKFPCIAAVLEQVPAWYTSLPFSTNVSLTLSTAYWCLGNARSFHAASGVSFCLFAGC